MAVCCFFCGGHGVGVGGKISRIDDNCHHRTTNNGSANLITFNLKPLTTANITTAQQ